MIGTTTFARSAIALLLCLAMLSAAPGSAGASGGGGGGGGGGDGHAKPAETGKPGEQPASDKTFVRMKPLVVPVIGRERVEQFIAVEVTLEVADGNAATKVYENMPRVIDAFIEALYGAFERRSILNGELVNIRGVKRKLIETSDKLLGKGLVKDVLIQSLHQRKL